MKFLRHGLTMGEQNQKVIEARPQWEGRNGTIGENLNEH